MRFKSQQKIQMQSESGAQLMNSVARRSLFIISITGGGNLLCAAMRVVALQNCQIAVVNDQQVIQIISSWRVKLGTNNTGTLVQKTRTAMVQASTHPYKGVPERLGKNAE